MRSFAFFLLLLTLWLPSLSAQVLDDLEYSVAQVEELLDRARAARSDAERYQLADLALSIARDLRYDGGIARAYLIMAQVRAQNGRPEEALQFFLEAEEKLTPTERTPPPVSDRAVLREVYTGIGDLFFREKDYPNARRYYRQALQLSPANEMLVEKIGDAFLLGMQYDSAEVAYKSLISQYKSAGKHPELIQVYQKLATAYNSEGNLSKGLFYYLAIEDILERHGSPAVRAVMYNNVGKQYALLNDYPRALNYFRKAELQCQWIDCDHLSVVYANMGVALHNTGQTGAGIEYLHKAGRLLEQQGNRSALAPLKHLIASIYLSNRDAQHALEHNTEAMQLAEATQQPDLLAKTYRTAADIYYQLYEYEKAYHAYREYLRLNDELRRQEQERQQRLEQQRSLLNAAENQIKYLLIRQNIRELELQNARYEQDRLRLQNENLELERQRQEKEVELLLAQRETDRVRLREQTLLALKARSELQLAAQRLDAEKKERTIALLKQQEQIALAQRQADSARVEQMRLDQVFQQREQASFRRFVYTVGGFGLLLLGLLTIGWFLARQASRRLSAQNREIERQKAQIEEERHKSDQLLLNILPAEVAHELRTQGYATPRLYPSATVVFTDFLNFTSLSEKLTPEQLIDELDECFLGFDEICERYGLEKIKTIGDAYMCAGGLPVPNDTHPLDAVSAALEMMAWLEHRNQTNPKAIFREMRVGIHTGPVIAGVIGKNKFAYDIWGDAVNLASRLEMLGEPGRINISGATYEAIRHRFRCAYRGKKAVHNKGLVDMYFVEGPIVT
ncbi:MAG: adenylate/guanylate cyclase domain-containing protein [Saprospiraceae bacterium]|nr:tetratricopeptide repeat protein [Saprospiraceae bacterium]MDW8228444.1 adenylate/guanylate cyclase domain-containing protein [Saprospiraceae bacterium]